MGEINPDTSSLKKLVRKGECLRCGACCAGCSMLDVSSLDKAMDASCTTWDSKDAIDGCKTYPTHPQFAHPDCKGYTFFDAETDEQVFRKTFDRPWKESEYWEFVMQGYAPVVV